MYKPRIVDEILERKLDAFGGTLIVGPKGCGKTTTAKQKAKTVIEFQDEEKREKYIETARISPSRLLIGDKPILFDEWQDAPKIWGACRKSIDDEQKNGLYILTGSSSQSVGTPHTGTGRISTLKMYPMSLYESGESNGSVSLMDLFNGKDFEWADSSLTFDKLIEAICRGGWPRSLTATEETKFDIAEDLYYQTCNVDISNIDGVKRNPLIADKILKSYARNLCTLVTNKNLISDSKDSLDISDDTFKSYVEALQKLYIIEDIPAWCPAIRSKTTIRSGLKRNLIDPSIAVAALGLSPEYFNRDFKTLGFLFECLCIRDLKIYSAFMRGEASYYRDRYGLEADCVLHLKDGRYALIEFKLGSNEVDSAARHLSEIEKLIKEYNAKEKQVPLELPTLKLIITGTDFGYKRKDGILVIPIGCLKP